MLVYLLLLANAHSGSLFEVSASAAQAIAHINALVEALLLGYLLSDLVIVLTHP